MPDVVEKPLMERLVKDMAELGQDMVWVGVGVVDFMQEETTQLARNLIKIGETQLTYLQHGADDLFKDLGFMMFVDDLVLRGKKSVPPVIANPGNLKHVNGAKIKMQFEAVDPIGTDLEFKTDIVLPTGLTIDKDGLIDNKTLAVEFVGDETSKDFTVTLVVTNEIGVQGFTTFTWTVTKKPA